VGRPVYPKKKPGFTPENADKVEEVFGLGISRARRGFLAVIGLYL